MGKRRAIRMTEAKEETVKRIAYIMGEMSAAQQAIDRAAEYMALGMTVKYWFTDDGHTIVEGITPEEMREAEPISPTGSGAKG